MLVSLTLPEKLLRKILWEVGYVDFPREDLLVIDGSIDGITPEEGAWIEAFFEEMRPVAEAQELAFWEKTIPEHVKRKDEMRLRYFAENLDDPARRLAREALKKHFAPRHLMPCE